MTMDRKTAVTVLIGAIKGASEYVGTPEGATSVINGNLNALAALGVTDSEIREAIVDAPFLNLNPRKGVSTSEDRIDG